MAAVPPTKPADRRGKTTGGFASISNTLHRATLNPELEKGRMLQGKGRRNLGLIVALGAALLIFSLPTDASDMDIIHRLFMHHREIVRKVTDTQTGAETMTESDNPEVAQLIQQHVAAMRQRIEGGVNNTLHKWDPLFVSLFEHGHLIHLHVTNTTKGEF